MEKLLFGRELLFSELPDEIQKDQNLYESIPKIKTVIEKTEGKFCRRCQSKMHLVSQEACKCKKECAYCRKCIQMGKVRACEYFYHLPEENHFAIEENYLSWVGKLSPQQKEASQAIIETIHRNETRLIWAVTGAGKTEMLFEGIEVALKQKKRVCIATPRVDVALELAPRIQRVFPEVKLSLLHGDMEHPYEYTQLVLSTTHQLFRFKEAFDVLIIDEIDAFPFHLDNSLKYAAKKARKPSSALIYLSATPDGNMQKQISRKKLNATILPARYHGYPLPVPSTKWCANWKVNVLKKTLQTSFGKELDRRIKRKQRCLVFAPNIEWMAKFELVLRKHYPNIAFESVSAEDPYRKEKVLKMRQEKIQFLITTTILERGVTFPNIDVLVIGAEDRIFTEAALVQIAGRCGRAADYPTGDVIYFHDGKSLAMKKAIRQIKQMNQTANKRGLLG